MQTYQFDQVGHPEVRQLLSGREYPGIEVRVVVLEPGDTLSAAGYSEEDSDYVAEYVDDHPGWRELCFVTDQYGNGTLVFIPR